MSNKQKKEPQNGPSEEDRAAACAQMLEEAVEEDDHGEELEYSEEAEGTEYKTPFLKPMQGRKVWIVLAAILVVIAVVVLYVYQAGDKKTILGNQPIPVGQLNVQNLPIAGGAGNVEIGRGAQNVPVGGGMQIAQNAPAPVKGRAATNMVQCPQCSVKGLPVCTSCGAVMQPLGDGSGLFACPSCGSVGIPICPRDGAHMTLPGSAGLKPAAGTAGNIGGQFQCPACRATGLPNWDPTGVPICPNCGAQMNVRAESNPRLAAAP